MELVDGQTSDDLMSVVVVERVGEGSSVDVSEFQFEPVEEWNCQRRGLSSSSDMVQERERERVSE